MTAEIVEVTVEQDEYKEVTYEIYQRRVDGRFALDYGYDIPSLNTSGVGQATKRQAIAAAQAAIDGAE